MPIVDVRGVPTYHEITGSGAPLVLLHGGFCSLETMRALSELLSASYTVHAVERPGHGRTPDRPGPFSYDDGVLDTLAYLDAVGLSAAHVVGFSDGAIIGLLLARDHATRVSSLVAISANLDPTGFDGAGAAPDGRPDADRERADYLALSPDGPSHVDEVLGRLGDLWTTQPQIPPASLATVTAPTLVMAADRDVIAAEHTRSVFRAIPGARLAVVPGTSHLLVGEKPALVARLVLDFLGDAGRR